MNSRGEGSSDRVVMVEGLREWYVVMRSGNGNMRIET
jgi:hypothetical protein